MCKHTSLFWPSSDHTLITLPNSCFGNKFQKGCDFGFGMFRYTWKNEDYLNVKKKTGQAAVIFTGFANSKGIPHRTFCRFKFFLCNTFCFLISKLPTTYVSSVRFLACGFIGNIDINVPKSQYNVLNKTMYLTAHVAAYKATVCWPRY
jgi:hypothetical protein